MSKVIGKVSIKVWPDTDGFYQALKRELKKDIDRAEKELPKVNIGAEVDDDGVEQGARSAANKAQRAAKSAGDVEIKAKLVEAEKLLADVKRMMAQAKATVGDLDVKANVDTRDLVRQAREGVREAEAAAGDIEIGTEVERITRGDLAIPSRALQWAGEDAGRRFGQQFHEAFRRQPLELPRPPAGFGRQVVQEPEGHSFFSEPDDFLANLRRATRQSAVEFDKLRDATDRAGEKSAWGFRDAWGKSMDDVKGHLGGFRDDVRSKMFHDADEGWGFGDAFRKDFRKARGHLDAFETALRQSHHNLTGLDGGGNGGGRGGTFGNLFGFDDEDGNWVRRISYKTDLKSMAKVIAQNNTLRGALRDIKVNVKIGTKGAASALSRLSGFRLMREAAKMTWDPLKNFDVILPKLTAISMLGSQASFAIGTLASNIFTLGNELGRVLPLALAVPGAMASFGIGAYAMSNGLKSFFTENKSIQKKFGDISKNMLGEFWTPENYDRFEASMEALIPILDKGMGQVSGQMGKFAVAWAESFNKIVGPNMPAMFEATTQGFKAWTDGADGFMGVLRGLGLIGARVFPRFMTWTSGLAESFSQWMDAGLKDNSIDTMLNRAAENALDLGGSLKGLVRIWGAIGRAAEAGGGKTLAQMNSGFNNFADTLGSDRVQRVMTDLFAGAHTGMEAFYDTIGPGLGNFMDMLSQIAKVTAPKVGRALGGAFGAFFDGLSSPVVGAGLDNFVTQVEKLSGVFQPVLKHMGESVAVLDVLSSAVVPFGSLVGSSVGGILDLIDSVGPSLSKVIGDLSIGLDVMVREALGPLKSLPGSLGPILEGVGGSLRRGLEEAAPVVGNFVQHVLDSVGSVGPGIVGIFDEAVTAAVGLVKGVSAALSGAVDAASDLAGALSGTFEGFGSAAAGAFESLGGLIGEAIGLAGDLGTAFLEALGNDGGINWEMGFGNLSAMFDDLKGGIADSRPVMQGFYEEVQSFPDAFREWGRNHDGWGMGSLLPQLIAMGDAVSAYLDRKKAEWGVDDKNTLGESASKSPIQELKFKADTTELQTAKELLDDIAAASRRATEGSLGDMRSRLVEIAPAAKEYWTALGGGGEAGGALAATNAKIVGDALAQVDTALSNSKLTWADWGDSSSAGWQKATAEGSAASEGIANAQEALRTALEKTGLTYGDVADMLASGNLSSAVEGDLATLMTLMEQTGIGMDDARQDMAKPFEAPDISAVESTLGAGLTGIFDGAKSGLAAAKAELESMLIIKPGAGDLPEIGGSAKALTGAASGGAAMTIPPVDTSAFDASVSGLKTSVSTMGTDLSSGVTEAVSSFDGLNTLPAVVGGAAAGVSTELATLSSSFSVLDTIPATMTGIATQVSAAFLSIQTAVNPAGVAASFMATSAMFMAGGAMIAASAAMTAAQVTGSMAMMGAGVVAGSSMVAVGVGMARASLGTLGPAAMAAGAAASAGFRMMGSAAIAMGAAVAAGSARAVGAARSAAGGIRGAFGGAGGWLVGAGRAIMSGLISGINSMRGALAATLASITASIPANKGPISVDRVLLKPAGGAIMEGLSEGLMKGFDRHVKPALHSVTDEIAGTEMNAPTGVVDMSVARANRRVASGIEPGSSFESAGKNVNVTLNIHNPAQERSSETVSKALQLTNLMI